MMHRSLLSIALALAALLSFVAIPPASATPPSDPIAGRGSGPHLRRAEISHDYLVGSWETDNQEFNRDVQIFLTLWNDSRLFYHFKVDGVLSRGSTGTWSVRGFTLREDWMRPDGSTGSGIGHIEKIDDDTFRLTIIDNGFAEYRGLVRIYRRRGPPQLS